MKIIIIQERFKYVHYKATMASMLKEKLGILSWIRIKEQKKQRKEETAKSGKTIFTKKTSSFILPTSTITFLLTDGNNFI